MRFLDEYFRGLNQVLDSVSSIFPINCSIINSSSLSAPTFILIQVPGQKRSSLLSLVPAQLLTNCMAFLKSFFMLFEIFLSSRRGKQRSLDQMIFREIAVLPLPLKNVFCSLLKSNSAILCLRFYATVIHSCRYAMLNKLYHVTFGLL